jgi:hypothetical protein
MLLYAIIYNISIMDETLRNVIYNLLEKIEHLRQDNKNIIARCHDNCKACNNIKCSYRRLPRVIRSKYIHLVKNRN